jgi:hypothetical protein
VGTFFPDLLIDYKNGQKIRYLPSLACFLGMALLVTSIAATVPLLVVGAVVREMAFLSTGKASHVSGVFSRPVISVPPEILSIASILAILLSAEAVLNSQLFALHLLEMHLFLGSNCVLLFLKNYESEGVLLVLRPDFEAINLTEFAENILQKVAQEL